MVEAQFHRPAEKRKSHPVQVELVCGADLSTKGLRSRPDAAAFKPLVDLIENAEYWLSFELSSFEPLLARAPSPLRELGVGTLLRFGEGVDGRLSLADLTRAREQLLLEAPADLSAGIAAGLDALARAVHTREAMSELEAKGFASYQPGASLSVTGLRAGGKAKIALDGAELERDGEVELGVPVALEATDERGKSLAPPEVESDLGAPLLSRTDKDRREIVFLVPGKYRLRVPGKSEGARAVLAR